MQSWTKRQRRIHAPFFRYFICAKQYHFLKPLSHPDLFLKSTFSFPPKKKVDSELSILSLYYFIKRNNFTKCMEAG